MAAGAMQKNEWPGVADAAAKQPDLRAVNRHAFRAVGHRAPPMRWRAAEASADKPAATSSNAERDRIEASAKRHFDLPLDPRFELHLRFCGTDGGRRSCQASIGATRRKNSRARSCLGLAKKVSGSAS